MMLRRLVPALWLLPVVALAQSVDLNTISKVEVKGSTIEITGTKKPNFTTFTMTDPPRLVIDISEAVFSGVPDELQVGNGTVTAIKTASYGSDASAIARVLIGFEKELETDIQSSGSKLVVRVVGGGAPAVAEATPPAGDTGSGAAAAEAERKRQEQEAAAQAEAERKRQAEAQAAAEADRKRQEQEAAAQAEAERKRQAEAQAAAEADRKRQEQEAQASAKAAEEERKRQEREAQASAAAAEAERKRQAEAEARAARESAAMSDAERKKQEQEARAAAEAARKTEAENARAEAARKREEEAAAKAQAAADKKREQEEARAEAARKREEAAAAKADAAEEKKRQQEEARAEAARKREEEAAAKAQAAEDRKRQQEEARASSRMAANTATPAGGSSDTGSALNVSSRRKTMQLVGFKQQPGSSRVFVRTDEPVRYTVSKGSGNSVVVELENTRIDLDNNDRSLDTSFFDTAVAMIDPQPGSTRTVRIEIKLKESVPYQTSQQGNELYVDFERPARR